MKTNILLLASLLFMLYSCNKSEISEIRQKNNNLQDKNITLTDQWAIQDNETEPLFFPGSGKEVSDFVPSSHEIQYEAEGDLNGDGFPDRALVIRKKSDSLSSRNVLILLQNPDQTYCLDVISKKVLPTQYNKTGRKVYDTEGISIEKNELNIQLYDLASNGNLFSKFKYLNNSLVLTYVETYSMATLKNTGLYYEVMKGKLTEEVMSMMKKEPFLNTQTHDLVAQRVLFENSSPQEVITNAYQSLSLEK